MFCELMHTLLIAVSPISRDNACMKVLPAALATLLLTLPLAASAQTTATSSQDLALRASIQSALLSDPRTDQLPPEQLDILVTALAADAVAHHIKPADISYTPRMATDFGVATLAKSDSDTCPLFSCIFAQPYGLDGNDPLSAGLLFATSGALALIIRRMMRPQHLPYFVPGSAPAAPPAKTLSGTPAPQAPP